jgi:hypothetical protein
MLYLHFIGRQSRFKGRMPDLARVLSLLLGVPNEELLGGLAQRHLGIRFLELRV